jgi:hypothetical protein
MTPYGTLGTMSTTNIFEEDWRDCLRAHYFHVIKERDENNERSLVTVLLQTGFTEEDIAALRNAALAEYGWQPETPATEVGAALEPSDLAEMPAEGEAQVERAATPVESVEAAAEESGSDAAADATPPDSGSVSTDSDNDEPPAPLVQMSLF